MTPSFYLLTVWESNPPRLATSGIRVNLLTPQPSVLKCLEVKEAKGKRKLVNGKDKKKILMQTTKFSFGEQ